VFLGYQAMHWNSLAGNPCSTAWQDTGHHLEHRRHNHMVLKSENSAAHAPQEWLKCMLQAPSQSKVDQVTESVISCFYMK